MASQAVSTRARRMIMSTESLSFSRRGLLATAAAASAVNLLPGQLAAAGDRNAIRPFTISVPDEQLVELRRRIVATLARKGDRRRSVARRAARDDAGTGALL